MPGTVEVLLPWFSPLQSRLVARGFAEAPRGLLVPPRRPHALTQPAARVLPPNSARTTSNTVRGLPATAGRAGTRPGRRPLLSGSSANTSLVSVSSTYSFFWKALLLPPRRTLRIRVLGNQRATHSPYDGVRQLVRPFNAIIERHAAVTVAAKEQPTVLGCLLLDPRHPFQMAELILRNGSVPADHALKNWLCLDAEGLTQIGPNRGQQAALVPANPLRAMPTTAHRSQ